MSTNNTSRSVRVNRPHRDQVEMLFFALDQLLPVDHRARIVWPFFKSLDLEPLYAEIEVAADQAGRTAIAPEVLVALWLQQQAKEHIERLKQEGDTDEYAIFRARMAKPEYQQRYRLRPSIAEFPNVDCRNRGLRQFRVRGLLKVEAVALWHALAFNLIRMINRGPWSSGEGLGVRRSREKTARPGYLPTTQSDAHTCRRAE